LEVFEEGDGARFVVKDRGDEGDHGGGSMAERRGAVDFESWEDDSPQRGGEHGVNPKLSFPAVFAAPPW
jgi:hypothetical protein